MRFDKIPKFIDTYNFGSGHPPFYSIFIENLKNIALIFKFCVGIVRLMIKIRLGRARKSLYPDALSFKLNWRKCVQFYSMLYVFFIF